MTNMVISETLRLYLESLMYTDRIYTIRN